MTRATLSLIGHILVVAIRILPKVARTVGGIFPLSVLAAELFRDLAKGVQGRFYESQFTGKIRADKKQVLHYNSCLKTIGKSFSEKVVERLQIVRKEDRKT